MDVGRAGPDRDFSKMLGRAGPRLTKYKFDGPGRAATHEMWALHGPAHSVHEVAHVF